MKPFDMSTITRPESLYGRDDLLKRLTALARRNDNVQIIGSRRFGKTCVLRCMYTILRNEKSIYPIYVDIKSDAIKDTINVYKYLISVLVEHLYRDDIFTKPEKLSGIELTPCDDWTEIYEYLQQENVSLVKSQKLFSEIVNTFAELMEKNILIMFDEYEYMFKFSFNSPEGFMKLRTLSTSTLDNGIHPLSFWIAGSKTWDEFCTLIGSGELNVINATENILPISFDDFSKFWMQECESIEECELRTSLTAFVRKTYDASGGVPFYAKQIGSYYLSNGHFPTYNVISNYLSEIESGLHPQEKKILDELRKGPKVFAMSNFITNLEIHGLITIDPKSNQCSIPIGFYLDYLKANQLDKSLLITKETVVRQYVKQITDLVENINKTYKNKKDAYMFEPVNDSASLEDDLRVVCYDKDQFKDFCSALYRFYLERSKDEEQGLGGRLPKGFRWNRFHKIVDMCRHTFGGGHEIDMFEIRQGQLNKADVLKELLGSDNEPYKAEEFAMLQQQILVRCIKELEAINVHIRK